MTINAPDPGLQRIARITAKLLRATGVVVSGQTAANAGVLLASHGLNPDQIEQARSAEFLKPGYAPADRGLLISDLSKMLRHRQHPLVVSGSAKFCAHVPLVALGADGLERVVGALSVFGATPREALNPSERAVLREFAALAGEWLELKAKTVLAPAVDVPQPTPEGTSDEGLLVIESEQRPTSNPVVEDALAGVAPWMRAPWIDLSAGAEARPDQTGQQIEPDVPTPLSGPAAPVVAAPSAPRSDPFALEGSGLTVFAVNAEGELRFLTGRALPEFGLEAKNLGKSLESVTEHPELVVAVQRGLRGETTTVQLNAQSGAQGHSQNTLVLEAHVAPVLDVRGEITGAAAVLLEPSQAPSSPWDEGPYRTVFEHAPVAMALVALDGRVVRQNRLLRNLLGFASVDAIADRFIDFPNNGPSDEWPQMLEVLQGKRESYVVEKSLRRRDGTRVSVSVSVSRIPGEPGEPDYLAQAVISPLERPAPIKQLTERLPDNAALANARNEAMQFERERIARELHDGLGKEIFGLAYHLEAVAARQQGRSIQKDLLNFAQAARELGNQSRAMIADYRSGEQPNFKGRLEALVREAQMGGLPPISLDLGALPELDANATFELTRVAQEALENVKRHANASQVIVRAATLGRTLELSVLDNGRGLPSTLPEGRFGLQGMRERIELLGGTLEITSNPPNGGTMVRARLPLTNLLEH